MDPHPSRPGSPEAPAGKAVEADMTDAAWRNAGRGSLAMKMNVAAAERLTVVEVAPNFWRAEARYGFMERPDVPTLLASSKADGCAVDLSDVTYFVGHETVLHREDSKGLPAWQEALFSTMQRNASHVSDFFSLPSEGVVEIGCQILI